MILNFQINNFQAHSVEIRFQEEEDVRSSYRERSNAEDPPALRENELG